MKEAKLKPKSKIRELRDQQRNARKKGARRKEKKARDLLLRKKDERKCRKIAISLARGCSSHRQICRRRDPAPSLDAPRTDQPARQHSPSRSDQVFFQDRIFGEVAGPGHSPSTLEALCGHREHKRPQIAGPVRPGVRSLHDRREYPLNPAGVCPSARERRFLDKSGKFTGKGKGEREGGKGKRITALSL